MGRLFLSDQGIMQMPNHSQWDWDLYSIGFLKKDSPLVISSGRASLAVTTTAETIWLKFFSTKYRRRIRFYPALVSVSSHFLWCFSSLSPPYGLSIVMSNWNPLFHSSVKGFLFFRDGSIGWCSMGACFFIVSIFV